MSEPWDRRTYPVTFQLCTESNLDRVELYCSSNNWTTPLARLSYAYKDSSLSQAAKCVYLHTLILVPGNYEYKYKVNNRLPCVLNNEKKIVNDNNILTKDDFIQLIVERCDLLERERIGETITEGNNQYENENTNVDSSDVGSALFQDRLFPDIELIINGTEHCKAHKAILSVHSTFFKNLFSQENMKNSVEIRLEVENLASFKIMFKYLYTSIFPHSLDHQQFKSLYQIATTYEISTLIELIKENLSSQNIDVNNCLLLLSMENELKENWLQVRRSAIEIIVKNFRYLCHQNQFLKLDYNIIQDIFCHSYLKVPSVVMANMSLNRWLNTNEQMTVDVSRSINALKQYRPITNRNALQSSIVCYFADGSPRYTNMTINSINSFLRSTPKVMVGLLVKDENTRDKVMFSISKKYHYRILCKQVSQVAHFQEWNPTQYKLDILIFLDHGFEEIYWIDSDTIVYDDLTPHLIKFRSSDKLFYFVLDHVMYDSGFINRWNQQHQDTFIPQACFMGFKSTCMRTFFALWKNAWKMWIEPRPFTMYQDPNPDFDGSSFCTEQYALGNAISEFIAQEASLHHQRYDYRNLIFSFERKLVLIAKNEQLKSFYPSSKLRSMVSMKTYVSSQPHSFALNTYILKNSFYEVYSTSQRSSFLSKYHSMYSTTLSSEDTFIDSFFDSILHFYNQNYQAGYQWYLKNFIKP
ncbi:hypothetical protein I4U23_005193 [Adineta vaga]|nr:hypothetical protein I4U23_005193 [Adineta vaga]